MGGGRTEGTLLSSGLWQAALALLADMLNHTVAAAPWAQFVEGVFRVLSSLKGVSGGVYRGVL